MYCSNKVFLPTPVAPLMTFNLFFHLIWECRYRLKFVETSWIFCNNLRFNVPKFVESI